MQKLYNFEQILKKFIILKNMNASIDFGEIRPNTKIFQEIQNPIKSQIGDNFSWKSRLVHWCTEFQLDVSKRLWIIVVWKVENRIHIPTQTPSGRQLKITFLDISGYSECSDRNISIFFRESGFPYCFLTDFKKLCIWRSMMLNCCFLFVDKSKLKHSMSR